MSRMIATAAALVALALVAQAIPASAETGPRPRASAAGDSRPSNLAADQFAIWSKLSPAEWQESLEESCIEHASAACSMTAQQDAKLSDDIKTATERMRSEILANPAEVNELRADRAQQPRGLSGTFGNLTRTVTKFASSPAVRRLADKSDKIADIAGYISASTNLGTGGADEKSLGDRTMVAVATTVISVVPVLGDIWSLGQSIANGDVEGGVVAVVSLIGTAVGVAFPPAGAVIAVGLAIYYVGKMIFGFLCSKSRDWIEEPPGNPREVFESGADVKWESHKVAGQDVAAQFRNPHGQPVTAVQTLLLDSKWTQYNRDRQPVRYLTDHLIVGLGVVPTAITATVWQGGRPVAKSTCKLIPTMSGKLFAGCNLSDHVLIMLNRPAVLKIFITYDHLPYGHCSPAPCVANSKGAKESSLRVRSEARKTVSLPLPYKFAFV